MTWNWQQTDWPRFRYDSAALEALEARFLLHSGEFMGAYRHIDAPDKDALRIELITDEALKTSEIEGENPGPQQRPVLPPPSVRPRPPRAPDSGGRARDRGDDGRSLPSLPTEQRRKQIHQRDVVKFVRIFRRLPGQGW